MTQHTMNLCLGFIFGWCMCKIYVMIKTAIVKKIKKKQLIKEVEEYSKWMETPEGQEYKKQNTWLE